MAAGALTCENQKTATDFPLPFSLPVSALLDSLQSLPGRFAAVDWLWLLLALPLLALLRWRAHRLSARGVPGLVSPRLAPSLVRGAHEGLRWTRFLLLLTGLAAFITALARPQFGSEPVQAQSRSRDLFIAVDTSRSMLALDLEPNRLARARLAIRELIDFMPEDRVGLVAFAGNAFLLAPLTLDHPAVIEALEQMEPGLVPRGGTNLAAPLNVALEQLKRSGGDRAALVIFSDGEDHEGQGDLALALKQAKADGLMVFCVGVGTESGAIIPDTDDEGNTVQGQFVKDDKGTVVRSRLQGTTLQEISAATGGLYVNLGEQGSLTTVVSRLLGAIEATSKEADPRPRPIERFIWPLAAGLLLVTLAWLLPASWRRRPKPPSVPQTRPATALLAVGAGLGLAGFFPAAPALAQQGESEGLAALRQSDYDNAIAAYEKEIPAEPDPQKRSWLQLGLGTAAYRKGDFEKAKEAFSEAAQSPDAELASKAHYNLGNTLFRLGERNIPTSGSQGGEHVVGAKEFESVQKQWKEALDQYQSALTLDPGNGLAKRNIEAVNRHVQVLRKQEEPPKEEEKKEDDEKDDEKDQEDQKDQQNQQDQQDQQDQQNQQNPQDQPDQQQPPPDGQDGQPPPQGGQPPPPKDQEQKSGENDPKKQQQPPPKGQPKPPEGPQPPQDGPQPEGDLSTDPSQPPPPRNQPKPEEQRNEETGLSPAEARKQLKDNTDEDLKAMPLQQRSARAERYKDW